MAWHLTEKELEKLVKQLKLTGNKIDIPSLESLASPSTAGHGVMIGKAGIPASIALKAGIVNVSPETPTKVKAPSSLQSITSAMGVNMSKSFMPNITSSLKGLGAKDILDVFKGMMEELDENIKDLIENKGFNPEETKSIAEGIRKGVTEEFEKFFKSDEGKKVVQGIIKPEEEIRTSFAKKAWDSIKHHIVHGFSGTLHEIKEEVKSDFAELRSEIKSEWDTILGPKLHALYDGILKTLKTVFSWLDPVKKWFKDSFMKGMSKFLGLIKYANEVPSGSSIAGGLLPSGAGEAATAGVAGAAGGAATGVAGGLGLGTGSVVLGSALVAGLIGIASYSLAKDLGKAFSGPEMKKFWDNMSKGITEGFNKSMDFFWGIGSSLYQLWETLSKPFISLADGMGAVTKSLNKFFGFGTGGTKEEPGQLAGKDAAKAMQDVLSNPDFQKNCGEQVTSVINAGLKASGISNLLESNYGTKMPEEIRKRYGATVYGERADQPITIEQLQKLGPGTVIAMTRKPGDKNYEFGTTHAEVTAINPATGQLEIASHSAGKGTYYKPLNEEYIKSLPVSTTAANPFQYLETRKGFGLLDKMSNYMDYLNPAPGSINVGAKGSISDRQNNPFNLKIPGSKTGAKGFTIFNTPEEGYAAGVNQLKLDQTRHLTADQWVDKYYGKTVPGLKKYRTDFLEKAGITGDTPISNLPLGKFAQVVAGMESSTTVKPSAQISIAEKEKAQATAGVTNQQLNVSKEANKMLDNIVNNQKNITNPQGGDTNIIAPTTHTGQQQSQDDLFNFQSDFYAQVIGLSLSALTV